MKTFDVFSNAVGDVQVVKHGFSWPGLFFSWIWGYIAKLWIHATVMLVASLVLAAIPGASLIVGIFSGYWGNDWRRANLRERGFNLVVTIEAESAEAAVNQFVANKSNTSQEITDSSGGGSKDTGDQLQELKKLLDDGVLTIEEYESKRTILVGKL